MSELGWTPPTPKTALPQPTNADNVVYNPSLDDLRAFSSHLETTTETGAPAYVSEFRSRSADKTKTAIDHDLTPDDYRCVDDAVAYAREEEMICLDRQLGDADDLSFICRFYVPRPYGRIALALATLLDPAPPDASPDFLTIQIPEWDDTAIHVFPEAGITTVLGSDYSGEAKKSFLRLFMYRAKQLGGLGLHAGSKRVSLRTDDGTQSNTGQVFLGLSATGKSTLTAHNLRLEPPESAPMLQDDVCALLPDGTVAGSEGNGLYVKTHGLVSDEQPAMYDAVMDPSTILENVVVTEDGTIVFDDDTYTANGRAVILRDHLSSAADDITLDSVDQVFFITRNPLVPPVAKLSPNEAAAAFMCGESIETSAGDPERAGESVRVVGTNPFIIGSKGEEGNRFRDLIVDLDVECYLLNTGSIGPDIKDIGVEESITIVRELARGSVEWSATDDSYYTTPTVVPGIDIAAFAVPDLVENYETKMESLRAERRDYLAQFDDLDEAIQSAV